MGERTHKKSLDRVENLSSVCRKIPYDLPQGEASLLYSCANDSPGRQLRSRGGGGFILFSNYQEEPIP